MNFLRFPTLAGLAIFTCLLACRPVAAEVPFDAPDGFLWNFVERTESPYNGVHRLEYDVSFSRTFTESGKLSDMQEVAPAEFIQVPDDFWIPEFGGLYHMVVADRVSLDFAVEGEISGMVDPTTGSIDFGLTLDYPEARVGVSQSTGLLDFDGRKMIPAASFAAESTGALATRLDGSKIRLTLGQHLNFNGEGSATAGLSSHFDLLLSIDQGYETWELSRIAAVPEPDSSTLLALTFLVSICLKRKRRR